MELSEPHLLSLPQELLLHILSLTLAVHPSPSHILVLNKYVHVLATDLLYTDLQFSSAHGLASFAAHPTRLPRTVSVQLPGGEVGRGAFRALNAVFSRLASTAGATDALALDALTLCMHSTGNLAVDDVEIAALGLVNPARFTWTGPDPAHHFSTAIVPVAFTFLARHMAQWTHLRHLHLTNVAFPPLLSSPLSEDWEPPEPFLPALPRLCTVYIGQATMVPLKPLAAFVLSTCEAAASWTAMESVRLVDCYVESIWGARVRRRDVEQAAVSLVHRGTVGQRFPTGQHAYRSHPPEEAVSPAGSLLAIGVALDRVRSIVRCEALTERIVGGDRAEGPADLD